MVSLNILKFIYNERHCVLKNKKRPGTNSGSNKLITNTFFFTNNFYKNLTFYSNSFPSNLSLV